MLSCLQSNLLYEIVGTWLLLTGIIGFLAMGIDKARAIGGEWRIPEITFFVIASVGGSLGVAAGAVAFHHKTSKLSFLAVLFPILGAWLYVIEWSGFLGCLGTFLPH